MLENLQEAFSQPQTEGAFSTCPCVPLGRAYHGVLLICKALEKVKVGHTGEDEEIELLRGQCHI